MAGKLSREEKRESLIRLRKETGMNRREFSEYVEIPYRTLQDWELGNREMPGYLFRFMTYFIMSETEQGHLNKPGGAGQETV